MKVSLATLILGPLRNEGREQTPKELYRSRTDREILRICGCKYLNIDLTMVRVIAVVSIFVGTMGHWAYIVMRLIVPEEPVAA